MDIKDKIKPKQRARSLKRTKSITGYSSSVGKAALFAGYDIDADRPEPGEYLIHVDCPYCTATGGSIGEQSITNIMHYTQFNSFRPMLSNPSKPQSRGKCTLKNKTPEQLTVDWIKAEKAGEEPKPITAYWIAEWNINMQDTNKRLRIDEHGDIVCPQCGAIFNNDDTQGYFAKITPIESSTEYYNNDFEYGDHHNKDDGDHHKEDDSWDDEEGKPPEMYLVPDLYYEGRLIIDTVVYVNPLNNQAKIFIRNIEQEDHWVILPKDLHRDLSNKGYLPPFHGSTKHDRRKRSPNKSKVPDIEQIQELMKISQQKQISRHPEPQVTISNVWREKYLDDEFLEQIVYS